MVVRPLRDFFDGPIAISANVRLDVKLLKQFLDAKQVEAAVIDYKHLAVVCHAFNLVIGGGGVESPKHLALISNFLLRREKNVVSEVK